MSKQETWKSRLKAQDFSQLLMAQKIGITPARLCNYLNCKVEPSLSTGEAIEDFIFQLEMASVVINEVKIQPIEEYKKIKPPEKNND